MTDIVCRVVDCHVFCRNHGGIKYLLMRRSPEVIYAGSWRMVGGKIESGEKAFETAIRELKEETGLLPKQLWAVPYVNQFYEASKDRINIIPVLAVEVSDQTVKLSREHDLYEWCSYEKAKTLLPWPAQLEGMRIVEEFIVQNKEVAGFVEIPIK